MELGERLRIARTNAGLTQLQVVERMPGMARTTLVAIEQGKRRVRAEEMARFEQLYGCPIPCTREVDPPAPVLSARKRVMARIWKRVPDEAMMYTLQTLQVPRVELERMAATVVRLLIAQEEENQ